MAQTNQRMLSHQEVLDLLESVADEPVENEDGVNMPQIGLAVRTTPMTRLMGGFCCLHAIKKERNRWWGRFSG